MEPKLYEADARGQIEIQSALGKAAGKTYGPTYIYGSINRFQRLVTPSLLLSFCSLLTPSILQYPALKELTLKAVFEITVFSNNCIEGKGNLRVIKPLHGDVGKYKGLNNYWQNPLHSTGSD